MRRAEFLCRWMLLIAMLCMSSAESAELAGHVIAVNNGQPVAQAAVTLTFPDSNAGPKAITVFSGPDGAFRISDKSLVNPARFTLAASKLGYKQLSHALDAPKLIRNRSSGRYETRLYVEAVADIAAQVPASAWTATMPAGDAKNITLTSCSSCHQVPSPRMREFAARIEAVSNGPQGDKTALEEWRKVVRHESWRTIVKYMRSKHFAVFPLESAVNLDAVDWATAQNADYNFFNVRQGEIIARYLADHFPKSTASMARDAYAYGAPLGVTDRTVIREFAFPKLALVRELVPVPNTPYLWGADVRRNVIVRLNPENGDTKWYPVTFRGATGPHTIVPDDAGNLWVSMVDNDQFGRFDPKTEKWKLWTLRPSNLTEGAAIGGAAIVHDMSIDSRGHLARDAFGKIWLTLVGTNQMGTLDPDTGEVAYYDTNHIEGLSPINHLIYSTVLSEDGRFAWYSQVNGSVGCINTASKKIEKVIPFAEGVGPRRMSRDNAGNLWVALFGSGQVAKIDMASGKVLATYDLPDRSAAPYAVSWDERRKAVWVANANSDAIYRLDSITAAITVYPMPRQMAYMRQIAIDQKSGRLIATYGNYPEGSGPSMGVMIDVGD
jgi:streptogramin lyase